LSAGTVKRATELWGHLPEYLSVGVYTGGIVLLDRPQTDMDAWKVTRDGGSSSGRVIFMKLGTLPASLKGGRHQASVRREGKKCFITVLMGNKEVVK
jgi:hypothetical protein